MCGIFAYNGKGNSIPLLIDGLRNLEYRGYDSAGVFGVNTSGKFYLEKSIGKVSNLASKVDHSNSKNTIYTNGIAHTRWATHGKVTLENTHPHTSNNDRFYIVHNGIIENYVELKEELSKKYSFYSETDSEVIAKLVDDLYDGDIKNTLERLIKKLIGAYAIVLIDKEHPDTMVGAKLGSPMIVGLGKDGVFLSSDINAINNVADEFTILEDNETVIVENGKYNVYSLGEIINKQTEKIADDFEIADKGDFETFTEKEIHEVPNVLINALKGRINFENKTITNETLEELNTYDIDSIEIIASGSSYFAGVVGGGWFKELAGIKTEIKISSEFLYEKFLPSTSTLYIFISQSGETADVRESLKMVQQKGCLTFGIVNVVGSTIARMADMGLYSHSGIEVGVASTKNIVGQLAVLLLIAISMGNKRDLQNFEAKHLIEKIGELPNLFKEQLKNKEHYKSLAKKYSKYDNFFYLGRNLMYGTAAECSLKLKELSYLHAECYSTGELKHGPLALITPDFPCIAINPKGKLRDKTISNIKEIGARNGTILGVITQGDTLIDIYDDIIEIPDSHELLNPFLPLIPLWIFSVEIAKELGKDIDKPQNLAKSVTVE
ncbi:glutamine--fructose-6-phosphate transaminase (isomerizing) [Candidatus Gracilibacteria bacterium 28_42_T64]|nr:glutamine--fructose-6-phosphate transaminase (isomerizing) [Candidatus Gracilibacteria bacterium 28_42_T64]